MNKVQAERFVRLCNALEALGMSWSEINILRRAERTLHRWAELECGDGNQYGSWCISRDEETGRPYMEHHHYLHGRGQDYTTRTPIADREAGALRRVKAICERHGLSYHHQGDPRGCALYILRPGDQAGVGGIAICID